MTENLIYKKRSFLPSHSSLGNAGKTDMSGQDPGGGDQGVHVLTIICKQSTCISYVCRICVMYKCIKYN